MIKKVLQKKYWGLYCAHKGYGCVAQLVEQLTLNQWVWGSNPHAPTNKKSLLYAGFFVGNFARGKFEPGGWRNKKCQSNDIF